MKRNIVPLILVIAIGLIFSSCSMMFPNTSSRVKSYRHVRKIMKPLGKYYKETGAYPETLDALSPKYLDNNFRELLHHDTKYGSVWSIQYKRIDPQNYDLWFYHVHYTVQYRNGKFVGGGYHPFL